jgi:hypothetical protein
VCSAVLAFSVAVRAETPTHSVHLLTSKTLTVPAAGFVTRTNTYPATIVVSDGRYAALLNQEFGTEQTPKQAAVNAASGPASDAGWIFE